MEENLGRRGAKLRVGDADRAHGELGLEKGAGNLNLDMLGRLLAKDGL